IPQHQWIPRQGGFEFVHRHRFGQQDLPTVVRLAPRRQQVTAFVLSVEPFGVVRQHVIDFDLRGRISQQNNVHTFHARPTAPLPPGGKRRGTTRPHRLLGQERLAVSPIRTGRQPSVPDNSSRRAGRRTRSAGNQSTAASSSADNQRNALCSTARGCPPPSGKVAANTRSTFPPGKGTSTPTRSPTTTSTPSSSRHSRRTASTSVSPASTRPPGNSHSPATSGGYARCCASNNPFRTMAVPTTSA